jgi:YYY domain-containing protein
MSSDLLAFLLWYLTVTLAGLIALPLTFRFFRHLPDRGYTLARSMGLLVIGWAFWLLGSLGILRNDSGSIVLAALLVGGVGLWWLKREGLNELRLWLSAHRAAVVAVEALFLAAFALMAWVRAYNPEISGTEKPMELMFLNSVYRSPTFPPTDAWLSGHAISYYYFGYVIVASLARLTNTAMPVAFNLGLALLFALTAVGSLGVVMNLIALTKKEEGRSRKQEAGHPSSFLLPAFWPALLAPALVLVVGNFYGVVRLAHANGTFANVNVPVVRYDFGEEGAASPGVRAGMVNVWTWLDLKGANTPPGATPESFVWDPGFWWWFAGARVVHDRDLTGREEEAIDEMPAFSFILGDLHPHVLALPFVLLAIGLAFEWLLWGASQSSQFSNSQSLITTYFTRLFISAVILGGLSFLNTWDFPIYWFLTTTALVSGLGLALGWEAMLKQWRMWGALAVSVAILSVILYLPFYFTFQTQASGILPNLIFPTRFQQTAVMFGPVLVGATILTVWLFRKGRAVWDREIGLWAGGGLALMLIVAAVALTLGASLNPDIASAVDAAIAPLTRAEATGLMWGRRFVDSFATLFPAVIIGMVTGLGVGLLRLPAGNAPVAESASPESTERPWRRKRQPAAPVSPEGLRSPALFMTLAMLLTGALLLLGPEYVYLRDYFGTRMNTLFKFYFQTWILWALASAFGLWYMARFAGPTARGVMTGAMTLAMLAGLAYTLPGLYSKTNHFANTPTLDGLAYYKAQFPGEWEIIAWFEQNAPGQTVVAEAVGGSYSEFGRVAMGTGLPTLMGWDFHERQWRGAYFDDEKVVGRPGDVQTLYQTRDWTAAQEIIGQYNIEYVVVSPIERNKYKPISLAKFDQHMRVVFQSDSAIIYQRLESQAQ